MIEFTTETLSGIPSIIFGLFGMVFFGTVSALGLFDSLRGADPDYMILPIITRTTQEALKTVPESYRTGALGIGATKWYMIRTIILPSAYAGHCDRGDPFHRENCRGIGSPPLYGGKRFSDAEQLADPSDDLGRDADDPDVSEHDQGAV